MQRTGRIIYNGAMALSLLVCLATLVLWVRSYWVWDVLQWDRSWEDRSWTDYRTLDISLGGVRFEGQRHWGTAMQWEEPEHFTYSRLDAHMYPFLPAKMTASPYGNFHRYAALGFEWVPHAESHWVPGGGLAANIRSLTLPLYFPCFLFALLPAHYFLRVRRRRRIARRLARGCCPACGYDLRASTGRCPECGRGKCLMSKD